MTSWCDLKQEDFDNDETLLKAATWSSYSGWADLSKSIHQLSRIESITILIVELLFFHMFAFFLSITYPILWLMEYTAVIMFCTLIALILAIDRYNEKALDKAQQFYDALVKYELRNKVRVLPEQLTATNGLFYLTWMPRERPKMSNRDWTKVKWALRMDHSLPLSLLLLLGFPMAAGVMHRSGVIHLPGLVVLLVIFVPVYTLYHVMWWPQFWWHVVFDIAEYENITGERLIPDHIRPWYELAKAEQERLKAMREEQKDLKDPLRQCEPPIEKIRQWKREPSR